MESTARAQRRPAPERYCVIVAELDALIDTRPAALPVYSLELARSLGMSVRTLQEVTWSVLGMRLHDYIRLKRLQAVRGRLLRGAPSVKAVALENGFWHLGDFARAYRRLFGELPSQTRARAIHGDAKHLSPKHPIAFEDRC